MIVSLNFRDMSCLVIFPLMVCFANFFAATIFVKQILRIARISLPGRSDQLIEIIDCFPTFRGFSSQIKLHPRSLNRAAGSRGERASRLSPRYRATFKRPPPPPLQPGRATPFLCGHIPPDGAIFGAICR